MTKLRISPDLTLPIEAVTEAIGLLGRRGSGKTYAAQKLVEEFHRAHAQFVVLDPVGNWWSLRLAADGVSPGIPVPVFGGLHGDVPLEPTAGKMIADLIVDRGISAIIDVSQFESDADKARFATDFGARFYYRKKASPSAVHLVLEECQEFVPQNPQKEETRMLHAYTRIVKLGRNFGIGVSMLSQRPQEVNKKVLNLCELLLCFQLTGPQERKTVDGWISEKGIDEDISGELPKLARGTAHAWSPAWLGISKVVAIGEKWTLDASSTPKVGTDRVERELSPIDLEKIKTDMAATIEKAKADDPKELRKRIAELERAQRAAPARTVETPVVDQRAIERAVLAATKQAAWRRNLADQLIKKADNRLNTLHRLATDLLTGVDAVHLEIVSYFEQQTAERDVIVARPEPRSMNGDGGRTTTQRGNRSSPVRRMVSPATSDGVTGVEQKILNTLKALEDMGVTPIDKPTAAALVGYHPNAKSYANALGSLRSAGRVDYPTGGQVSLTDDGRAIATSQMSIDSLDELHQLWFDRLGNVAQRILEPVIKAYRNGEKAVDVDWLAAQAGYHPNAKSFANTKGRLRTLGLIDYPSPGKVIATRTLFPEGLY